jgi:hypothetical protein
MIPDLKNQLIGWKCLLDNIVSCQLLIMVSPIFKALHRAAQLGINTGFHRKFG